LYKYFDMASIYQKLALVAAGTVLSVGFQNNTKVAAFTYNEAVDGDIQSPSADIDFLDEAISL
jgi:hypothetical protein